MKKILVAAIVIAACAALCAAVWPQTNAGGIAPADAENGGFSACMDDCSQLTVAEIIPLSDDTPATLATECAAPEAIAIKTEKEEAPVEPIPTEAVSSAALDTPTTVIEPAPPSQGEPVSSDPHHTDVYPNNVYSEELIYDADGNLTGKVITYPTEFGPDTIWIDNRVYYDLPGFGLIEWSGPGQRTEDYTMYESGVKVGIMGGEDEAPASNAPIASPELTELTGEVIDQTNNTRPEKSSTPHDNKPNTASPDNGEINQQYAEQQIKTPSAGTCPH